VSAEENKAVVHRYFEEFHSSREYAILEALPPTPQPEPAPPAGAARARRHHPEACLPTPCSALRSPSERNDMAMQ
jgi:hypothetical protein